MELSLEDLNKGEEVAGEGGGRKKTNAENSFMHQFISHEPARCGTKPNTTMAEGRGKADRKERPSKASKRVWHLHNDATVEEARASCLKKRGDQSKKRKEGEGEGRGRRKIEERFSQW